MNHVSRIRRIAHLPVASTCVLVGIAASAPAAFALRIPAPGVVPGTRVQSHVSPVAHTPGPSGTPVWQIALIVSVVVAVSAAIALIAYRAKVARRLHLPAT